MKIKIHHNNSFKLILIETFMNNSEPYASTKNKFYKNFLTISPSMESDFEKVANMKLGIYKTLAPTVFKWYKKNPQQLLKEFEGYEGQELGKRVSYIVQDCVSRIVGSGSLIQADPLKNPQLGELGNLCLTKEFRGQGLGEAITKDLIGKARRMNFESIYLTTRTEFEAAVGLYKKLGFEVAKKQKYPGKSSISLEIKF
jgi:ribosomal protein S18 acetylase RimI-like enzyme